MDAEALGCAVIAAGVVDRCSQAAGEIGHRDRDGVAGRGRPHGHDIACGYGHRAIRRNLVIRSTGSADEPEFWVALGDAGIPEIAQVGGAEHQRRRAR